MAVECQWTAAPREKNNLTLDGRRHGICGVHATARSRARARVLLNVLHDLVGRELAWLGAVEVLVDVRAVLLVAGRDVDGAAQRLRVAGHDGAAVDHDRGPVVAGEGHDDAGHVLVTARQGDAGVVVLRAGDRLDAVGYDLAGLQGETHAWWVSNRDCSSSMIRRTLSAHGDAVRHADGVVLPCQHLVLLNVLLDLFAQSEHCQPSVLLHSI